jgi:hypothetical protein
MYQGRWTHALPGTPSRPATKYPPSAHSVHQGPPILYAPYSLTDSYYIRALVNEILGYPVVNGVTVLVLPPAGIIPDFDHLEHNKRLAHFLVYGIRAPLAFLVLYQRFYTKRFLLSKG